MGSSRHRDRGRPLTLQERTLVGALIEAYPDLVPADCLLVHVYNHVKKASVGDPVRSPTSQVSRVRLKLGADAIETVWPTRLDAKGRKIKPHNVPPLGYRAGKSLIAKSGSRRR